MEFTIRSILLSLAAVFVLVSVILLFLIPTVQAGPKPESYWNVDDVRAGMKGMAAQSCTARRLKPSKPRPSACSKTPVPGRDLVLCRLSGLNLDKTGVIAGMSGSPVYIENKLLGAVAYAWAFGKEPIAGVTPFSQMHGFVEAYERRDMAEQSKPVRVGLNTPLRIEGREFDTVTVSHSYDDPLPATADGLWMVPLRTPLCASGFTPHSLAFLRDQCRSAGLLPMQSGAATAPPSPNTNGILLFNPAARWQWLSCRETLTFRALARSHTSKATGCTAGAILSTAWALASCR